MCLGRKEIFSLYYAFVMHSQDMRLRKKPPMKDFNFAFSEVPMNHIFEFKSKKIGDLTF